ncbi:MAG: PAS domain S-box protein [Caldilinea sp. CFX5]|nr:PAS domain S-box protein [Caldilinea sp. CFX5]
MTEPERKQATAPEGGAATTDANSASAALFPIIAMLAAGNRQAVDAFCRTLPDEAGMAFIVVTRPTAILQQHLPMVQESVALSNLRSVDTEAQTNDSLTARVKEELLRTSERLQTILDEYATSTQEWKNSQEELHAINAELKTTTAALATSNEALHAITAELTTVKDELTRQLEELIPAAGDALHQERTTPVTQDYAHLEAALQQIPVGVIIAEAPSGKLLWSNAQVAHIWRHPDCPAATIDDYQVYQGFHPDGRPYAPHEWPLARAITTGAMVEREEIAFRRGDGTDGMMLVSAVPIRDSPGRITTGVVIFEDITERKQAEADLRLLTTLAEQIRLADNAEHLTAAVVQLVGEHLQVGRCLLIEVDKARNRGFIRNQYCRDLPPVATEYQQTDYAPATSAELAAGRVLINHDAQHDPRTAAHYATVYAPQDERAYIGVPLFYEGVWRGILSVTSATPRQWQAREVHLLETIAERLWLAVEKLRLDAEVRIREARFRQLADAMPQIVWSTNGAGRIEYINAQWLTYSGMTLAESLEHDRWPALHPAELAATLASWRQAVATGATYEAEVRLRRADGAYCWFLERAVPIRDEQGAIRHWFGAATDIHARKVMEATLREREMQLQLITDNMPALIAYVDAEERYQFANAQYTEWFGAPAPTLIGRRLCEVLDAAAYAHVQPYLQMAFQGRRTTFENEYQLAGGATRIGSVTYVPDMTAAQQILGAYVFVFDITERKQTEQRVRLLADLGTLLATSLDYKATLQQLAQLLIPHLGDWCGVEIVGPDGELEPVALAHRDPTQLPWARELRQRYRPHPDGPRGIARVIRTGQPEWYPEIADEMLVQAAQDETHLALLRQIGLQSLIIVPLQARGQTLGALSLGWATSGRCYGEADLRFAEEVTQRAALTIDNARLYREARTAEAQLRAMNEQLEQRVRERTVELERSNRELDQFAYIASHDLKAPLRGILNLAGWIAADAGAILPASSLTHLQKLRGRAQGMERLLDDLLTYARIGRSGGSVELVKTAALLQDTLKLLTPPATFTVTVSGELPVLRTVRVPLELVFRNLINNAIKHHHQPAQGVIHIQAQDLGDLVEFAVSDNGPGIDPQYHDRIFGMFQTLQPRDAAESSGLGLAIVKRAVEAAGGAIRVESSPGAGATFRFTWPKEPVST